MAGAFVTLLQGQGYVAGAVTLAKTIKHLGTSHSLIVLVDRASLDDASLKIVDESFDKSIDISDSKVTASIGEVASKLGRTELAVTYSKILLWSLVEYDLLVYLDSDTLPLKPLDHLFEKYGEIDENTVVAAPDIGWPDLFNTGLLILKPSKTTFDKIREFSEKKELSFDGADQGLFNEFFNLQDNGFAWLRLPYLYNVTPTQHYQYVPALTRFYDQISVVHFIGEQKPWNLKFGDARDEFAEQWWQNFNRFFHLQADRIRLLLQGLGQAHRLQFKKLVNAWDEPRESELPPVSELRIDEQPVPKVFPWEQRDHVPPTRVFKPINYSEEASTGQSKRVSVEGDGAPRVQNQGGDTLKNRYDQFDGGDNFDPDKSLDDVAKIPLKFLQRKASK